jgi:hypothetical protein
VALLFPRFTVVNNYCVVCIFMTSSDLNHKSGYQDASLNPYAWTYLGLARNIDAT